MRDYPKGVIRVYDNGGKTLDRYTVYYIWGEDRHHASNGKMYSCVGMSCDPFEGIGQHTMGMLGKHNGKIINFHDLPEICRELVSRDLKGV
jgi:hypothetical protein